MRKICERTVIALCFLILISTSQFFAGCEENLNNPTYSNDPNNGGGGDNDDDDNNEQLDLGIEYFHSTGATSWESGIGIRIQDGNIFAENATDSLLTEDRCFCMTTDSISFAGAIEMVSFTWSENINGEGSYSFYISDNRERWQEIPNSPQVGLRVASYSIFFSSPVFIRFGFEINPHSAINITNIRGYGK